MTRKKHTDTNAGAPCLAVPPHATMRQRGERIPTVAEYFRERLGRTLVDSQHGMNTPGDPCCFGIDSECGRSCAQAIDAAARLIEHVKAASGSDAMLGRIRARTAHYGISSVEAIRLATEETVLVYVYG